MRTVNFEKNILRVIAGHLGIDHTTPDMRTEHVRGWIPAIDLRMEEAWESLDLMELRATEERAFRTIWNASAEFLRTSANGVADEFLYLVDMTYYRVRRDPGDGRTPSTPYPTEDPPAGTLPTDTGYFEQISPFTDLYIELDQRGRHAVGEVIGVYSGNPRFQNAERYWQGLPWRLSERGIEVGGTGASSVWLRFKIRPSKFTADPWDGETVYSKRDLVLYPLGAGGDGNCYRALQDSQSILPTQTTHWSMVPVPAALASFVALGAVSDLQEDLPSSQKFEGKAQAALLRQYDKLPAQNGRKRYSLLPKPRPWGAGFGWCYSPVCPMPAAGEVTTLTDIWQDDEFYAPDHLITESGESILV